VNVSRLYYVNPEKVVTKYTGLSSAIWLNCLEYRRRRISCVISSRSVMGFAVAICPVSDSVSKTAGLDFTVDITDTSEKSNYQKMLDGEYYTGIDGELFALSGAAQVKIAAYHKISHEDMQAQFELLREIVGEAGEFSVILTPFSMEYGRHVRLGRRSFVNSGATFLDSAPITIGEDTMIGPNVQFITATHPVEPEKRLIETPDMPMMPFRPVNIAKPISIGSQCWIGAGVIILPGVTIGDGTTIGAGAVVTKDIPSRVVAVGNPAKVIRTLSK